MSKAPKTVFVCQECGTQSPKWLGRCADCGAWNSLVEERPQETVAAAAATASLRARRRAGAARLYSEIELEQHARMTTGIGEFDRVLGGGVVPGSLVLLGGEPGIGKSTLLLQAAANMARTAGAVLYSSGEESEHQIKSRGERLAVGKAPLLPARRNLPRADPRRDRAHQAGARHRRLGADGVLAEVSVARPAASARCERRRRSCCSPRRGRTFRPSSSATSPRTAASPDRKRSSTSSTPCCISKASATTRTASFAP